jgi:hypothetical protein
MRRSEVFSLDWCGKFIIIMFVVIILVIVFMYKWSSWLGIPRRRLQCL